MVVICALSTPSIVSVMLVKPNPSVFKVTTSAILVTVLATVGMYEVAVEPCSAWNKLIITLFVPSPVYKILARPNSKKSSF